MSTLAPEFLVLDDALALHDTSLAQYGGGNGVRDLGLLASALAQPTLAFGEHYAHDGLFAMAAAYLFHIARNHPFIDGNKRTALLAALVFLDLNGVPIDCGSEAIYTLTMAVAEGRIEKGDVAAQLELAAQKRAD